MKTVRPVRRPLGSQLALGRRRRTLVVAGVLALGAAGLLALLFTACGGGGAPVPPPPAPAVQPLNTADVQAIVQAAVDSAAVDMVVAVVDRAGLVLAVYRTANAPSTASGNFGAATGADDLAVALARTGAFFSNNQAPLSSRTVRFLSGIHFPPGVQNQPPADLYGIENTNRGCTLVGDPNFAARLPPSRTLAGGPGPGIVTGKKDLADSDPNTVNPGGVPVFFANVVLGGVGVVTASSDPGVAEYAARSGATAARGGTGTRFGPTPAAPGVVILGGIALPFVQQTTRPAGFAPGPVAGAGGFVVAPANSPGPPPDGDLIPPAAGPLGGLTAAEVRQILDHAEAQAGLTRAAIRLPPGSRTRMVLAVADLDGTLIGVRRMPDSTVFSVDVAASKARNMVYFNGSSRLPADLNGVPAGTAVTSRTISFGAQPLFPPGIDGTSSGPFFSVYTRDVLNPCTQGFQGGAADDRKSGVVFFPGSAGLYRNGVLVGGLGVSGDGVDQDDLVTSAGTQGFEAPEAIRADQILVDGVRLPYFKFPRNPTD